MRDKRRYRKLTHYRKSGFLASLGMAILYVRQIRNAGLWRMMIPGLARYTQVAGEVLSAVVGGHSSSF